MSAKRWYVLPGGRVKRYRDRTPHLCCFHGGRTSTKERRTFQNRRVRRKNKMLVKAEPDTFFTLSKNVVWQATSLADRSNNK